MIDRVRLEKKIDKLKEKLADLDEDSSKYERISNKLDEIHLELYGAPLASE